MPNISEWGVEGQSACDVLPCTDAAALFIIPPPLLQLDFLFTHSEQKPKLLYRFL